MSRAAQPRSLRLVAMALLCTLHAVSSASASQRLAIARIEPESVPAAAHYAALLTERLAAHPLIEVVARDGLSEMPTLESRARLVRRVAFAAKIDAIVVGRLDRLAGGAGPESTLLVSLRSGHSGGVLGTHRVRLRGGSSDAAAIQGLAQRLFSHLGIGNPPTPDAPKPVATGEGAFFGLGGSDADQPIEIESDELEFDALDDDSRRLLFTRNVRVVQGGTMLTTDRLEALYPSGSSQPDRLVAEGNVRVSQSERRATCDRAIYLREDEVLTCEGRAELLFRCDIVRGNSIRFDLARDRAKVVGAASVLINPDAGQADPDCRELIR